jgi:hypothetical protein
MFNIIISLTKHIIIQKIHKLAFTMHSYINHTSAVYHLNLLNHDHAEK